MKITRRYLMRQLFIFLVTFIVFTAGALIVYDYPFLGWSCIVGSILFAVIKMDN